MADSKETVFASKMILRAAYKINPATSNALSGRGYVATGRGGPNDVDFAAADIRVVEMAAVDRIGINVPPMVAAARSFRG